MKYFLAVVAILCILGGILMLLDNATVKLETVQQQTVLTLRNANALLVILIGAVLFPKEEKK